MGLGDEGSGNLLLRFHRLRHHCYHRGRGQKPKHFHPVCHHRLTGHLSHCLCVGQCLPLPSCFFIRSRTFCNCIFLFTVGQCDPDPHGSLRPDRRLGSTHGDVCGAWLPMGEIHNGCRCHRGAHSLPAGLLVSDAQGHICHGAGWTAVQVGRYLLDTMENLKVTTLT